MMQLPITGWMIAAVCLVYMVVELRRRGQPWYSTYYSQSFVDVWTISHFGHGVFLYLASLLIPVSFSERIALVVAAECLWESFENRNFVINWFRKTDRLYFGDSLANSLGDVVACLAGAVVTGMII